VICGSELADIDGRAVLAVGSLCIPGWSQNGRVPVDVLGVGSGEPGAAAAIDGAPIPSASTAPTATAILSVSRWSETFMVRVLSWAALSPACVALTLRHTPVGAL
jgi:hypothetical protein